MRATWSQQMRIVLAAICVAGLSFRVAARGDDPPANPPEKQDDSQRRNADPAQAKKLLKLTVEQETQALSFGRSQHPELADLLERLKKNDPKEYARALLDVHRSQVRIGRLAEKDPQRFALELSLWQTDSRIRLLAAQLVIGGDETLEAGLKPLLAQRRELKVQLVQLDRTKAIQRMGELDRQLETLQTNPAEQDEQELNKLKQSVAKQKKGTVKPKKKKAIKKETPKSEAKADPAKSD